LLTHWQLNVPKYLTTTSHKHNDKICHSITVGWINNVILNETMTDICHGSKLTARMESIR